MDLGKLDPRRRENWGKVVVSRWFWVMVIGLLGFLLIQYFPWDRFES